MLERERLSPGIVAVALSVWSVRVHGAKRRWRRWEAEFTCPCCGEGWARDKLQDARGVPTEAEWRRLEPLRPTGTNRCGRWRDHRQVVNGILHRVRTGVQWRDLPERYGPWKTVYERHRRWSADGTWERLLQQVQAQAHAAGGIDWDVSVDSTSIRAHRQAAGARKAPPPVASKGRRLRHTGAEDRG